MRSASLITSDTYSEFDVLKLLHQRMPLSASGKTKYMNLYKGLEGEQQFSRLLKNRLPSRYVVLTDVLLEQNESEFQLDILVIADDTIYPLEVKNYDGDFVIRNDRWYATAGRREIRNPLHQVSRMEILLRNVLNQGKFNFSIESKVVFTHSEFFLYQAPLDAPLIFPTQINRFIEELVSKPFHGNSHQEKLVDFLKKQQKSWSTHTRLPKYTYEELQKGIVCEECSVFLRLDPLNLLVCNNCGRKEKLEPALLRSVRQYEVLFPDKRITVSAMLDWCNIISSRKIIRRILKKNLRLVQRGRYSYYVFKK